MIAALILATALAAQRGLSNGCVEVRGKVLTVR
jgi:hypothetical protein